MSNSGNARWAGIIVGSLKVAVVAFVVLNLKELRDAGRPDFGGTAVDAGLIAAGVLLLNAALGFGRRGAAPLAQGEGR